MQVQKGTTAAVFGLGAVGLAVVEACVSAGCSRIFAIDTNPNKEKMAKEWGATDFLNPKVRPVSMFPPASSYRTCCRANAKKKMVVQKTTLTYERSMTWGAFCHITVHT